MNLNIILINLAIIAIAIGNIVGTKKIEKRITMLEMDLFSHKHRELMNRIHGVDKNE